MFHFLAFILILFLVIVVVAFSIVGSLLRSLFGLGRRNPQSQSRTYTYTGNSADKQRNGANRNDPSSEENPSHSATGKKKIFGDDEGEYVDFEEVK